MNRIVYNDFAANAEKNATIPANGSSDYQICNELLNENDREILNYASFEGRGINLLDSSLQLAGEGDNIGYISSAISDNSKSISVDLFISLADGLYSAPGITFYFFKEHCASMIVTWLKDGNVQSNAEVFPIPETVSGTGLLKYYFDNEVENFNEIKISFLQTSTSNQFVKLAGIDLGREREITTFHSNIEIFAEIDPDCADVPGSTCDFVAEIEDLEPSKAQALYVYGKNRLFGKFIVDEVVPMGKNRFSFECSDAIMRLEKSNCPAIQQGTYTVNALTKEIHTASNLTIDANGYGSLKLTGFQEENTNRYAAAMLSFGTGCFLTSFGAKVLTLRKPVNKRNKIIPSNQILGRAEYKEKTQYSAIVFNTFSETFDTISEIKTAANPNKKATDSIGNNVFDQYSMIADADERFEELKESAFSKNEITARIELKDESLGDILTIETPYNGLKTGIIKSIAIVLGYNKTTATITMIERGFASNGGEA